MKKIKLKHKLICIALLGALTVCYTTNSAVVVNKGSNSNIATSVMMNNVVTFPNITFTAMDITGTSPQPLTKSSTINLDLGTGKADGTSTLSGRIKMDITMAMSGYNVPVMGLDIGLDNTAITFVSQSDPTDTINGVLSLTQNATDNSGIGSNNFVLWNLAPTRIGTTPDGVVTAYLFFKTRALTAGTNFGLYYRTNPSIGMTIQYH